MGKLSGLSTKSTPVNDDLLTGLDSEDSNNATKNKNFSFSSIFNYLIGKIDTDDVSEGSTNQYYTEAKVTANATVVGKADKTNVLELDNTTPFTPTLDYHPVTKKHLEDQGTPSATEASEGIVERATDAEFLAGTDTTRYVNSKQATNYTSTTGTNIIIGDSSTTLTGLVNISYEKKKEIAVNITGDISYEIKIENEVAFVTSFYARVYVNGVAVGSEHLVSNIDSGDGEQIFTGDLTGLSKGDLVQLYTYQSSDNSRTYAINGFKVEVGDLLPNFTYSTVNI